MIAATGRAAQRISFGEAPIRRRCGRRARRRYIAFTKQGGGQFAIGIMKPMARASRS